MLAVVLSFSGCVHRVLVVLMVHGMCIRQVSSPATMLITLALLPPLAESAKSKQDNYDNYRKALTSAVV